MHALVMKGICDICLKGKQYREPFNGDVSGPISSNTYDGNRYFV